MLDALKRLAGSGKAPKQQQELEALIATAREERQALSAMLTQVTTRSAKLTETGKAVDAQASLEALKRERVALEELRGELPPWPARLRRRSRPSKRAAATWRRGRPGPP